MADVLPLHSKGLPQSVKVFCPRCGEQLQVFVEWDVDQDTITMESDSGPSVSRMAGLDILARGYSEHTC